MKKSAKKPVKKSSAKKSTKKAEYFAPTYVALAVSTVAVMSLVAFAVIGWSMSL